jgi:hypothetical protein
VLENSSKNPGQNILSSDMGIDLELMMTLTWMRMTTRRRRRRRRVQALVPGVISEELNLLFALMV